MKCEKCNDIGIIIIRKPDEIVISECPHETIIRPELNQSFTKLVYDKAFKAGAEAMREIAAEQAWRSCKNDIYVKQVGLEKEVAKAIRSLPLPEVKKDL